MSEGTVVYKPTHDGPTVLDDKSVLDPLADEEEE